MVLSFLRTCLIPYQVPLPFLPVSLHLFLLTFSSPSSPPFSPSLKVLVVGGGDGGVLREVAKHKTVEEIHSCEIDEVSVFLITSKFLSLYFFLLNVYLQRVIEVSKRYLPQTAVGFSSPKVRVHIQDGAEFMQQCAGQFDVIITDSSDPIGEDSHIQYIYGYSQRELQRFLTSIVLVVEHW